MITRKCWADDVYNFPPMASTLQERKVYKNFPFYEKIARVDVFREKCYTALF